MDEPIKSPESQAEENIPETPVSDAVETTKAELNNTDDGEQSQDSASVQNDNTANVNVAIDGGSVDDVDDVVETHNNESIPVEKMEVDDTSIADCDSQDVEMNDTDKPEEEDDKVEDADKPDEYNEDAVSSDVEEKEPAELNHEEAGKLKETAVVDDEEAEKLNESAKLDEGEAGKLNEIAELNDEEAGKLDETAELDDEEAVKLIETAENDDDETGKLNETAEKSDKSAESKDTGQPEKSDDNEKISGKSADESMDQDELDRPEQVDMENLNETAGEKDKSVAEDPFDVLRNTTSVADESHQPDENDTVAPATDNDDGQDDDDDSIHHDDIDKADDNESLHQDDADKTAVENQEDAPGTTDGIIS